MRQEELINLKYFEWLSCLVDEENSDDRWRYTNLLKHLHEIDFTYTISMDGNRESDGIDLRYRFGDTYGYSTAMVATYLDDRSCSVLEMLVALALRCEEHIMYDPDLGDRTGKWFWDMIINLGLGFMTDQNYNQTYVDMVIQRFLNREYEKNGEGGLFTIEHCRRDLRNVEIWYQLCWYLDQYLEE